MNYRDIVGEVISKGSLKPDSAIEIIKAFTNTYIYDIVNLMGLEDKDYIIYLSGPMSGMSEEEYMKRFAEMEFAVQQAYSAHNVYIINPSKILNTAVKNYEFTYIDMTIICYALMSICNTLVYDNRDRKFENSRGCIGEISYATGKGIDVLSYKYIQTCIAGKEYIISNKATAKMNLAAAKGDNNHETK